MVVDYILLQSLSDFEKELDGVHVLSESVADLDSIRAKLASVQAELVSVKASLAAKDETIALLKELIPARETQA